LPELGQGEDEEQEQEGSSRQARAVALLGQVEDKEETEAGRHRGLDMPRRSQDTRAGAAAGTCMGGVRLASVQGQGEVRSVGRQGSAPRNWELRSYPCSSLLLGDRISEGQGSYVDTVKIGRHLHSPQVRE